MKLAPNLSPRLKLTAPTNRRGLAAPQVRSFCLSYGPQHERVWGGCEQCPHTASPPKLPPAPWGYWRPVPARRSLDFFPRQEFVRATPAQRGRRVFGFRAHHSAPPEVSSIGRKVFAHLTSHSLVQQWKEVSFEFNGCPRRFPALPSKLFPSGPRKYRGKKKKQRPPAVSGKPNEVVPVRRIRTGFPASTRSRLAGLLFPQEPSANLDFLGRRVVVFGRFFFA